MRGKAVRADTVLERGRKCCNADKEMRGKRLSDRHTGETLMQ